MNLYEIRNDFQNTIKQIRQNSGYIEYPKAIISHVMVDRNTAMVHCGKGHSSADIAKMVVKNNLFIKFLNKYSLAARIEANKKPSGIVDYYHILILL